MKRPFRWFTRYPTFKLRHLLTAYALITLYGIVAHITGNPDEGNTAIALAVMSLTMTVITRNKLP